MRYIRLALMLGTLLGTLPLMAEEGKRFALVIGNDAYMMRPLKNAVNDARAVDKALQAVGFKTVLVEDASKAKMEEEISSLMDRLGPNDTVLFYFSGHAVQIDEENVLIPVDMNNAKSITEAKIKSFSLNLLFEELAKSKAKNRIVILDSCRSNPITDDRGLRSGLAVPLKAGRGSYIAYSTSPGAVAFDNPDGKNSWFSEALAELIPTPNASIDDVFNKVKNRVDKASGGKQTPWTTSSLSARLSFASASEEESDNDPGLLEKRLSEAISLLNAGDIDEGREAFGALAKNPAAAEHKQLIREAIQYLEARRQADQSLEAGDHPLAAASYQRAFEYNPALTENAMIAASAYLLSDKTPEAVKMLKEVRMWGASSAIDGVNSMLKELAPVSPEAAAEAAKPNPMPPAFASVIKWKPAVPSLSEAERYNKIPATQLALADLPEEILAANKAAAEKIELARTKPPEPAAAPEASAADAAAPAIASDSAPQADAATLRDAIELVSLSATLGRDLRLVGGKEAPISTSGVIRPGASPLVVKTKPSGAELTVEGDDEQKCLSPCYLSLPPGRRVIHAKLGGYADLPKIVNMSKALSEENIDLVQLLGTLRIHTKEPLPIVLDSAIAGKSSGGPVRVPAGKYELRVMQQGKLVRTDNIEVKDGVSYDLKVE